MPQSPWQGLLVYFALSLPIIYLRCPYYAEKQAIVKGGHSCELNGRNY